MYYKLVSAHLPPLVTTHIAPTTTTCITIMTATAKITFIGLRVKSQPAKGGEERLPTPRPAHTNIS